MQALLSSLPIADVTAAILLITIYAASATFSGFSGFGFPAIGSLTMVVLAPQLAIPLLISLSLATQALGSVALWREFRDPTRRSLQRHGVASGVGPYLIGGVSGLPLGLLLLSHAPAKLLMQVVGTVVVCYAVWSLLKPAAALLHRTRQGPWSSLLVGAAGGVLGGCAAFPGLAVVIWTGLIGASKESSRSLTRSFILAMQTIALSLLLITHPHWFNVGFWTLFLLALPTTLLFFQLGVAIHRCTGDSSCRRITLIALGCAGLGLLFKSTLS